jgi:hypothetical protein
MTAPPFNSHVLHLVCGDLLLPERHHLTFDHMIAAQFYNVEFISYVVVGLNLWQMQIVHHIGPRSRGMMLLHRSTCFVQMVCLHQYRHQDGSDHFVRAGYRHH